MAKNGFHNGSTSIQTVTCASEFCRDGYPQCPHTCDVGHREKDRDPAEDDDPDDANKREFRPRDGGWGWVVCLASFWTNGTLFGIMNCFGVLYVNLEEKFKKTHEGDVAFLTSWVGSVSIGMTFLFSPVASILTDRYGIQRVSFIGGLMATIGMLLSSFVNKLELLYLTYGVIMGAGASLAYTPSLVILGHYFQDRIGLVNGIVTAGSSVFTMVMPLILKHLLKVLELKHTLQILSGMMAMVMLCALSFRPQLPAPSNKYATLSQEKNQPTSSEESNWCKRFFHSFLSVEIWKNKRYVLWVFAIPTALFGYFVPYVHLIKHVKLILPDYNGEILVTCIGLTSGIGRIVFGKIADFKRVNRIHLQQISFLSIGILTMLLVVAKQFPVLVIMCLFLGLFDGCFISLLGPIAFDIVGNEGASQAIGFLLGFCSIPLTVGPPIAGLMFDHLGNYTAAFLAAGAPPIVGAALMCLIHKISYDHCPHFHHNHHDHDHLHHIHHHHLHHTDILISNGMKETLAEEALLPEEKQKLVASIKMKELSVIQPDGRLINQESLNDIPNNGSNEGNAPNYTEENETRNLSI